MLSHICVISDLLNLEIAFFKQEIAETVQNLRQDHLWVILFTSRKHYATAIHQYAI